MDNEVEVVRSLQGIAQGLIKRSRESWSEAVMKGLVPEHESEYTHNVRSHRTHVARLFAAARAR
ncbi:hypothetical protein EON66_04590 [archaeon]|nr:MAG: hypothetical protein EON66_04590 [archaeon]